MTGRWEVVIEGPLEVYMVGNRFGETGLSYTIIWLAIFILAVAAGLIAGVSRAHGNITPRKTTLKILAAPALGLAAVLGMTRTITPTLLVLATIAIFLGARWAVPRLPQAVLRHAGWIVFGLSVIAFLVLTGGEPQNVNRFGGLLLTIIVSAGGIVLSFPIGVVMALARRSSFPLIRPLAVAYIELIRGVPLITLLFMGQFALGLFFPPGTKVPGAIPRAIIMITLFTGAYVAEVVRGGLQSVPKGQTEGAQSLGLSPLQGHPTDRAAAGAAELDPGADRPVHLAAEGHLAAGDHRRPGPAGRDRADPRAARLQGAGLPAGGLRVRLTDLLGHHLLDVARVAAARDATGSW